MEAIRGEKGSSRSHFDLMPEFVKCKRSQVTTLIIVAIIIVIGIAAFFIIKNKSVSQAEIPPSVESINEIMKDCVKTTAERALIQTGKHGGYSFLLDEPSIESRIPYYVYNGRDYMPDYISLESELKFYLFLNLPDCIDQISNISDFQINSSLSSVNVTIYNSEVSFDISYPISATKGQYTYALGNFNVDIPVRLGSILYASNKIVSNQLDNPGEISITYLEELAEETDLRFDIIDYSPDSVIFTITDYQSKLNNTAYEFVFADQHTW